MPVYGDASAVLAGPSWLELGLRAFGWPTGWPQAEAPSQVAEMLDR